MNELMARTGSLNPQQLFARLEAASMTLRGTAFETAGLARTSGLGASVLPT